MQESQVEVFSLKWTHPHYLVRPAVFSHGWKDYGNLEIRPKLVTNMYLQQIESMNCLLFQNGNTVVAKIARTFQLLDWQANSVEKTLMDQNLVPIRKSKTDREARWRITPEIKAYS